MSLATGVDFEALDDWQSALAVIAVALAFAALLAGTMYATLVAANHPPPLAIVVVLAALTLSLIAVFTLTREAELLTLAGMGLGALSGAVAAMWSGKDGP